MMSADSITSDVLGWGSRYGNRDAWTGKGTAILNLAWGGQGDDMVQLVPYGVELSWVQLEDLEDYSVAGGPLERVCLAAHTARRATKEASIGHLHKAEQTCDADYSSTCSPDCGRGSTHRVG